MEWILKSPQIHSAFASLGYTRGELYHVNDNCISTLEQILKNILSEDRSLRTYRRTVSFGQNVPKDLMPLLVHSKDEEMIGLLIKILMNLTIPVECLLPLDIMIKTDFGRHTIFELRNLLIACKHAFADTRATKTVIQYLKKNSENGHKNKLSMKQCENIHDCLTLLRNLLHIADELPQRQYGREHTNQLQNHILWNLFSQGMDKLIINLISVPQASHWSATVVQLVSLLYKDQHVGKLQKLLNVWLETSLSESSEDNESNTTPQNRGSSSNSPSLTTDQATSDSSDNGAKGKNASDEATYKKDDAENAEKRRSDATGPSGENSAGTPEKQNKINSPENKYIVHDDNKCASPGSPGQRTAWKYNEKDVKDNCIESQDTKTDTAMSNTSKRRIKEEWDPNITDMNTKNSFSPPPTKMFKSQKKMASETSDCGYSTQKDTRESISTSSNEDDNSLKKPMHIKSRLTKQKFNTKLSSCVTFKTIEEKRRKKMVKRGKSNILNVKGLQHHQPTDDDISFVFKEFTVDFMLKGYDTLVRTLHEQILNYNEVEIDRCHFFWLVAYFLKFATQMELEWEHVQSVLSFDVISFLTAEGVNLSEQFELAAKYNKADLSIWRRKLHLVVTAIREFVQAIETFKRVWSPTQEGTDPLVRIQIYMWETEELRSLMVLLIRSYKSDYHDRQYLQDLVVTNHLLLLFFDNVLKLPGYTSKLTMINHLRQFASPHMMWQYGILLENFQTNGEFVNDCVFTIMHHVGGEEDSLQCLYQENILHAFASIKQSDYEICDHWTDLVEYVVNSYNRKKNAGLLPKTTEPLATSRSLSKAPSSRESTSTHNGWTEEELASLAWNYMQSRNLEDVIGNVVTLYKEDGALKSRSSIIKELYQEKIIDEGEYKRLGKNETVESGVEDVRSICEELTQQGYGDLLEWVQHFLLEVCFVKMCLAKIATEREQTNSENNERPSAQMVCNKFEHIISPVAYHNIVMKKTISLVPWNCRQNAICRDAKFTQLLSKLGFYTPKESGMLFFRIPLTWTSEVLYEVALKISNIDTGKLKFSISDIWRESAAAAQTVASMISAVPHPALEVSRRMPVLPIPEHCYRIQRFKQLGVMVQYTPTPDIAANIENAEQRPSVSDHTKSDWMTVIKRAQATKMPVLTSSFESTPMCELNKMAMDTTTTAETGTASDSVAERSGASAGAGSAAHASPEPREAGEREEPGPGEVAPEPGPGPLPPQYRPLEREACEGSPHDEDDSLCDTASVASDFSRMYVSDEAEPAEWIDEFCLHDLLEPDYHASSPEPPHDPDLPGAFASVHHRAFPPPE